MALDVLRRVRWGNVARAAGAVALVAAVVAWPRLTPPAPVVPGPEARPLVEGAEKRGVGRRDRVRRRDREPRHRRETRRPDRRRPRDPVRRRDPSAPSVVTAPKAPPAPAPPPTTAAPPDPDPAQAEFGIEGG
jgi:hypothetical protein